MFFSGGLLCQEGIGIKEYPNNKSPSHLPQSFNDGRSTQHLTIQSLYVHVKPLHLLHKLLQGFLINVRVLISR